MSDLSDEDSDNKRIKKKAKIGNSSSFANSKLQVPMFKNITLNKMLWTGPAGEQIPSEELKAKRKLIGINAKGNLSLCPPPVDTMNDTGIPDSFRYVFKQLSHTFPTSVQKQCWPSVLSGANVLAIAPTGSGKTYAYGLPIIPHILSQNVSNQITKRSSLQPIALVLVPTRELAIQVANSFKVFKRLPKNEQLYTGVVLGGHNKEDVLNELITHIHTIGDIHILVATPGRLLDLITNCSNQVNLSRVTFFVLDEADKMLDLGFTEQITAISSQIRPERQTLLFSATFPGRLREIANIWMGGIPVDKSGEVRMSGIDDSVIIRCNAMEFNNSKQSDVAVASSEPNMEVLGNICDVLEGKAAEVLPTVAGADVVEIETNVKHSNYLKHSGKPSTLTVNRDIVQEIHVCASHKKPRLLLRYIESIREKEKKERARQPAQILVFCGKIKTIGFALDFLRKQNIACDKLCGQMSQEMREKVLNNFKAVS